MATSISQLDSTSNEKVLDILDICSNQNFSFFFLLYRVFIRMIFHITANMHFHLVEKLLARQIGFSIFFISICINPGFNLYWTSHLRLLFVCFFAPMLVQICFNPPIQQLAASIYCLVINGIWCNFSKKLSLHFFR